MKPVAVAAIGPDGEIRGGQGHVPPVIAASVAGRRARSRGSPPSSQAMATRTRPWSPHRPTMRRRYAVVTRCASKIPLIGSSAALRRFGRRTRAIAVTASRRHQPGQGPDACGAPAAVQAPGGDGRARGRDEDQQQQAHASGLPGGDARRRRRGGGRPHRAAGSRAARGRRRGGRSPRSRPPRPPRSRPMSTAAARSTTSSRRPTSAFVARPAAASSRRMPTPSRSASRTRITWGRAIAARARAAPRAARGTGDPATSAAPTEPRPGPFGGARRRGRRPASPPPSQPAANAATAMAAVPAQPELAAGTTPGARRSAIHTR